MQYRKIYLLSPFCATAQAVEVAPAPPLTCSSIFQTRGMLQTAGVGGIASHLQSLGVGEPCSESKPFFSGAGQSNKCFKHQNLNKCSPYYKVVIFFLEQIFAHLKGFYLPSSAYLVKFSLRCINDSHTDIG